MTDIKTPDCPHCGHPPRFTFFTPYFCTNDECDVVSWEPTMTLAEIRATKPQQIDLDEQTVHAWGTIVAVRAHYLDFTGISVQVERQEGMPFTFPNDILMATIDKDAEYQPTKGDRVKVTVNNGVKVERVDS